MTSDKKRKTETELVSERNAGKDGSERTRLANGGVAMPNKTRMTIEDKIAEILHNDDDAIEASNKIKGIWDANIYYRMIANKISSLPIMKKCPYCEGTKLEPYVASGECSQCKGSGEVPEIVEEECPSGLPHNLTGENCIHSGKIKRPKTLKDLIGEE